MKGRFPKLGVSIQTKKYSFCLISTGNIKITVIIIKSRGNVFHKSCSRGLAVEGKKKHFNANILVDVLRNENLSF